MPCTELAVNIECEQAVASFGRGLKGVTRPRTPSYERGLCKVPVGRKSCSLTFQKVELRLFMSEVDSCSRVEPVKSSMMILGDVARETHREP